ncbi:MAG TPA: hypothetical protein VK762_28910, partial [Polyangiaceae bacterium]|nr:hypothetical protein [Polyangiaceae bacterium]
MMPVASARETADVAPESLSGALDRVYAALRAHSRDDAAPHGGARGGNLSGEPLARLQQLFELSPFER